MIISFIPLRLNSKSIPRKNIKEICGKPLAQWVIDASNNSDLIEKTIIAVDSAIISDALSGVEVFHRSPETATDSASSESVLLEFCNTLSADDLVVFIQATSPLLDTRELNKGIELVTSGSFDSALSVVRQKRFIWNSDGTPTYDLSKRPRRQDWDGFLVENGAFYISRVRDILESECRISGRIGMVECAEASYFEIDEPEDWIIVDGLLRSRKGSR